jgi:hypothetical protein
MTEQKGRKSKSSKVTTAKNKDNDYQLTLAVNVFD